MSRALALLALLVAALVWAPGARAEGLDAEDRSRLEHGGVVRKPIDLQTPDGPYFGGIAYAVIAAAPARVMDVLLDSRAYKEILPLTLEATETGKKGDDRLLFLKQGGKLGTASYTLIVRRESPSLVRFWLDPESPHEIEDCWGYFRVAPFGDGKTLLTYASLLRLEFGMIRMLFSEKIRGFALDTPLWVRRYMLRLER